MGGIIFIVLPLFFIIYCPKTTNIAITLILYGVLGLVDDLLIIIKKNNQGLPPSIKLIIEVAIAGLAFYLYLNSGLPTMVKILSFSIDIEWFFGMLILGILVSSTNAFNLVDGVDGLCSGLSLIMAVGFIFIAIKKQEYEIAYFIICLSAVVFIFWCFNLPKAYLFMGDVGSLALGAFFGMIAIYLNCIDAYLLMALIFIFETASVMIQVLYFKKTGGKRFFKMAPFHHHLEASGFKEVYVDILFYIIQAILVICALLIV